MAKAKKKRRPRRMPEMPERELHVDDVAELEEGALLSAEEASEGERTFADDEAEAKRLGITPTSSSYEDKPSWRDQFFRKGAEKREAFLYISDHTGDVVDDEADDWIQHYYVSKVQGMTIAFFIALILSVGGVVVGNYRGIATIGIVASYLASFVALAAVIVFVLVMITSKRIYGKIAAVLDVGRDPETYCLRYLGYLRAKDPKDMTVAISNYARGLRWQGRWKDARSLFESYLADYGLLGDARAQFLHHLLLAGCAFDQGRLQSLDAEIAYLESVPAAEVPEEFTSQIPTLEKLSHLLSLERDGKKREAYELVEGFFYSSENVLRMALALHLGTNSDNRTDALEWINFVIKMGVTTWCVKRAKAIRSAGFLQKLPAGESRFGRNIRERRRDEREKRRKAKIDAEVAAEAEKTVENAADIPR